MKMHFMCLMDSLIIFLKKNAFNSIVIILYIFIFLKNVTFLIIVECFSFFSFIYWKILHLCADVFVNNSFLMTIFSKILKYLNRIFKNMIPHIHINIYKYIDIIYIYTNFHIICLTEENECIAIVLKRCFP